MFDFGDGVYSLKLRNGRYVIMQFVKGYYSLVCVYDLFRSNNNWEGVKLDSLNILTFAFVARNTFEKVEVTPIPIQPPESFIDTASPEFRSLSFWAGTQDECEVLLVGDELNLIQQKHSSCQTKTKVAPSEYDEFRFTPMADIRAYPEFNEMLYLSDLKKIYFDPLKEIAFDRKLGLECKPYLEIISGKADFEALGYQSDKALWPRPNK